MEKRWDCWDCEAPSALLSSEGSRKIVRNFISVFMSSWSCQLSQWLHLWSLMAVLAWLPNYSISFPDNQTSHSLSSGWRRKIIKLFPIRIPGTVGSRHWLTGVLKPKNQNIFKSFKIITSLFFTHIYRLHALAFEIPYLPLNLNIFCTFWGVKYFYLVKCKINVFKLCNVAVICLWKRNYFFFMFCSDWWEPFARIYDIHT